MLPLVKTGESQAFAVISCRFFFRAAYAFLIVRAAFAHGVSALA